MSINKCACLVITGCIAPDIAVPKLFLCDPKERRKQYIESIEFYIRRANVKNIVFCDNSDSAVEEGLFDLARSSGKNFEWLHFRGNAKRCMQQGKGYGEGELLGYALEHSKIIANCDSIIKVTGRLIVKNINRIMRLTRRGRAYMYPITKKDGKPYVCTKFFVMPKRIYAEYFKDAYTAVDDLNLNYIEHIFADVIQKHALHVKLLPLNPDIAGMSGTSGEVYHNTRIRQMWYTIRMHLFKK